MVNALTIIYSEEAIGIVTAAPNLALPVVISFTVETNGNLPSAETLKRAIEASITQPIRLPPISC